MVPVLAVGPFAVSTHDAFTISDVQTYEDIGLRPYGRGREFIDSGDAYFEGRLPTNLSGGLQARG